MTISELRSKYLEFFRQKKHAIIPSASLIPENDATVLFTTAGMHPLVPYLLGEKHPSGKRLADAQKCIRTGDIDDVGDNRHLTFFEMLGNWSLGDYFKEEAIAWSFEFLTAPHGLGFRPDRIFVTVFAGNELVARDNESAEIWKKLGISEQHIFFLPIEDNWWGPAGKTGPCGPDTEMFVDVGRPPCGPDCRPGCGCGKYFEIWNDVFMQYDKQADGSFKPLKQLNADTGMGVERTIAMLQGKNSVYETELFVPTFDAIASACGHFPNETDDIGKAFRVIADHLRSAVFIIGDEHGISPGNLGQGYVLRRLIRRAVRHAKRLGLKPGFAGNIAESIIGSYGTQYPELTRNRERIIRELSAEEEKFEKTLDQGIQELEKTISKLKEHNQPLLPGRVAFKLYDTYGFPVEFTEEICREQGLKTDRAEFEKAFAKHQDISRQGADKAFKGGLADHSEVITRLHTATHLMNAALRKVLGEQVWQKGSNITKERTRFDFTHSEKMTDEQKSKVEELVNSWIGRDLTVKKEIMPLAEAKQLNAIGVFGEKYAETVSVYTVMDPKNGEVISREFCGGPHVEHTGVIGQFKILKEEAVAAGIRRIKAAVS